MRLLITLCIMVIDSHRYVAAGSNTKNSLQRLNHKLTIIVYNVAFLERYKNYSFPEEHTT